MVTSSGLFFATRMVMRRSPPSISMTTSGTIMVNSTGTAVTSTPPQTMSDLIAKETMASPFCVLSCATSMARNTVRISTWPSALGMIMDTWSSTRGLDDSQPWGIALSLSLLSGTITYTWHISNESILFLLA